MTDNDPNVSGEARLRNRRRSLTRYFALVFSISVFIGFMSGGVADAYEAGEIPAFVPIAFLVAALAFIGWYTFDYLRKVDELDVMDNLWAHLIGMYVGLFVFAGWFFLGDLNMVPHPEAWIIVVIMIAATLIAYTARKLGLR